MYVEMSIKIYMPFFLAEVNSFTYSYNNLESIKDEILVTLLIVFETTYIRSW